VNGIIVDHIGDHRSNKAMRMHSISVAEVQALVNQLPVEKLPHAYRLLRDLAEQQDDTSVQARFMHLPVSERNRLLAEQAAQMVGYYENSER
jgi:hypothetical protein